MNGYERRRRERLLAQAARREREQDSRKVDLILRTHAICEQYEQAYYDLYKRVIKVTYSNGWYTVHSRKVRETRLKEMTRLLQAQLQEVSLNHPEKSNA